jgi:hypothetical protein
VDYLRERLKELEGVEVVPVRKIESATKRTLEARLNETQLSLLLDCVNELHLFAMPITADDLLGFFNCTLQSPLKLVRTKNKLFIYLLWQLESRGYITTEWQSVCAKERLLESCTGIVFAQNNLSSTLYQVKEVPPKGAEHIDKLAQQLRAHS